MSDYHSGIIKAGSPGKTRIVPSAYSVSEEAMHTPPPKHTHVHRSGVIVSAAPGSTRIIPSPSKDGGLAKPTPPTPPHRSGAIHSRAMGYTAITPLKEVLHGKEPEVPASPLPTARHPIRSSGDGSSTASFVYDGERGVEGVAPRPSGVSSSTGDNGEQQSTIPAKSGSGRIVSTSYGYTKTIPSPAALRRMAAEAGIDSSSPSRSRYVSSPIKSTSTGSTNAGSLMAVRSTPTSDGPPVVPTAPPSGYLPHGTIRYANVQSPLAIYVPPGEWAKDHPDAQRSSGTVAPGTGKVIRSTFPGYTNVSQ